MENVPDAVNSHKFKFSTQGKNKHFFSFYNLRERSSVNFG